ncbi:MAG: glutathione S-transferase C-terminal domain-containing protein [Chloroflexota bacterium]
MTERVIPAGVLARLGIGAGITFVQAPHSPYCISIRKALQSAGAPFTIYDTSLGRREAVMELTDAAYYVVPVVVDASRDPAIVVYEGRDEGTDVARYVDARFDLGLFPADREGLQDILVQYIENQAEDVAFRLDDAFLIPSVADPIERGTLIRHKERKFGRGSVDQWRAQAPELLARLVEVLAPLDTTLSRDPYLLGDRPTFADYALYGVLGNLTYTGDNVIPAVVKHILRWHAHLDALKLTANVPVPA